MLFYEFQISCSPAEELPSGYGEERRKREERLSELNELLYAQHTDGKNFFVIDRPLSDGFHMCGAVKQTKPMTAGLLGKLLAPMLSEACGIKKVSVNSLREITREQFAHYIEICDKKSYLNCCNPLYDLQLNYADNRYFRLAEEMGTMRPQLSRAKAYREADGLMADSSFLDELARIYSDKNERKIFYGHPVHYHITAGNSDAAMTMTRLLVRALYANKRLAGQRINRVYNIQEDCYDESDLDHLLRHAEGGTVVLEMCSCAEEERYAGSYERVNEYLAAMIRKYQRNTLFILVDLHLQRGGLRNLLTTLREDISFVHIEEGAGSRAQAAAYLQSLDAQSSMPHYTEHELEQALGDRHTFRASDIHQIHEKLYRDALKNKSYRAYQDVDFHPETTVQKPTEDAAAVLRDMVGLKQQKEILEQIVAAFAIRKMRTEMGTETKRPSMHMCFTGNPGTAKTTVARLLADILSKENILPTGRFIECGRSDLVAKYVGWTAVCVKEKFRAARGGILFIDEAYALLDDRSGSYGDEAISTIVQEMENHREDVIVIFAGYPKKMQDFLDANEGLRSRIAFHVSFPDYTADELTEILSLIARQQGYTLTEEIVTHCRTQFSSMCRQEDFGNGRFVRNVFEQALMKQSQRLWALREHHALTEDSLRQLTVADFNVAALQPAERRQTSMGFSVSHG